MLKSLSLIGLGAAALVLAAPASHAGDGPPPSMHMHPPSFDDLDANKDGKLTQDEFAAPMAQHFHDLDGNGDGVISRDEFDAGHMHMHDGPPPGGPDGHGGPGMWRHRMDLKSLDTNGDGKVSFDEFTAPMKQHFDEMDTDHDGALEQSELPQPHDGDGPPPPPPPGGN